MRARWLLMLAILFFASSYLPTQVAHAQAVTPKQDKSKDDPSNSAKLDDKLLTDLKKGFEDTQKELAETRKALEALKTKTTEESKQSAAKSAALASEIAGVKAGSDLTNLTTETKSMGEKLAGIKTGYEETKKAVADVATAAEEAATVGRERGDSAWLLTSSALVFFMVPGLALFYGGMVRRKNVLATMMESMAALAVVGVYWIVVGYALAFGPSLITLDLLGVTQGGIVGWSWDLVFLQGIAPDMRLPGYDIPVYLHVMFQGMFAIITPALISGAIAERIRFWPFCLFMILWVTFVYCPLAHMVWAFNWFDMSALAADRGTEAIGLLGKMGALDFAGGTVVHIAAGVAGLACCLVLGKRAGYPKFIAHPNSMVLTVVGAGLLWFGWFGFNGGSSLNSAPLAASAFAATQAAAAAAGLGWMLVEWIHKGKPTALGLASGIVAGLVAVTPASGFVYMWGGVVIGVIAAVVCYFAVAAKNLLGYDDSLDAFGVHGVGGFVGAVLTGVFCSTIVNSAGTDGLFAFSAHRARLEVLKKDDSKLIKDAEAAAEAATKDFEDAERKLSSAPEADKDAAKEALEEAEAIKTDKAATLAALKKELEDLQALADKQDDVANGGKDKRTGMSQVIIQLKAALFSVVFAFVLSLILCVVTQLVTAGHFRTNQRGESEGLDRTEHGEVGFDFSAATESVAVVSTEPRAASVPRGNGRFDLQIKGAEAPELMRAWTALCQPSETPADADFLAVYPYVTTVRGTTFRFRGGNSEEVARRLESLFRKQLGKDLKVVKV